MEEFEVVIGLSSMD